MRDFLVALGRRMDRSDVCEGLRTSTELVLAEVLNNIVEHARPDFAAPIDVTVRTGCDVRCRVIDRGTPMPGLAPPPGHRQSVDCPLEELSEGGYGWFLIRSLTRDLSYERRSGRNRLLFTVAATGNAE
ncbi:ATP-binding protein [Tropicimonas omnivorans]|uniref:ATP-binding protein n=1 Tax=Tropicimonas omnivorans TaxID=3075590 RepID=UPI003D770E8D